MIRNNLYWLPFLSALLASAVLTPLSIFIARKLGVVDSPDPRKVHHVPVPRWGGVGIIGGFFIGILVLWNYVPPFSKLLNFSQGIVHKKKVLFTLNMGDQLAGILWGAGLLFILGLFDDRKPVLPVVKFLCQIIAAFIAMTYGVRIYGLSIPGMESYSLFPIWLMQIVTILWLVGMTNAINLIDGLDGLAAGIVTIVSASFLAVVLMQHKGLSALYANQIKLAGVLSAALLGGSLGFLMYNFYPARVFMGDNGSLTSGFLLGCIAVTGAFKTTTLAVLFIPFLLVAIPIADMTVAFLRRLLKKQSPFAADKNHFHHALLRRNWTQREVVLLVYTITMVLSLISFVVVAIKHR